MSGVYANRMAKQLFDEYMCNLDGDASLSVMEAIHLWGSDLPAQLAVWSRRAAIGRYPDIDAIHGAVQNLGEFAPAVGTLHRACLRAFADTDAVPLRTPTSCISQDVLPLSTTAPNAATATPGSTWLPGAAAFEEHMESGKATKRTISTSSHPSFSRQPSGQDTVEVEAALTRFAQLALAICFSPLPEQTF